MKKIITLLSFVLLIALQSLAAGAGGNSQPLSLGLLSFYGYSRGAQVTLEWEAMTWSTSRVFTVERSVDGITWSTIQDVAAETGGSRAVRYSATDSKPIVGNAYYRIGLSNDLGERAVSNPVRIHTTAANGNAITLYPNPCADVLNLGGFSAGSTVSVSNSTGREVFRSTMNERLNISTGGWQSGIYFVTIVGVDGTVFQSKIMRI